MPKTLPPLDDHPLLIKKNGKPLDTNGIKAFIKEHGKQHENKPYIGVDREDYGDEYLIVGYFKRSVEQEYIDLRKIDVDVFAKHFANNLDSVVKRLINVILISIDGILTYKKVTEDRLKNGPLYARKGAVAQIKELAAQPHLKLELFTEKVDRTLLEDWLEKTFETKQLKDIFNAIHIMDNPDKIYGIIYHTANEPEITGVANVFFINNLHFNCENPTDYLPSEDIISATLNNEFHWERLKTRLEKCKINPFLLRHSVDNLRNSTTIEPGFSLHYSYPSPSPSLNFNLQYSHSADSVNERDVEPVSYQKQTQALADLPATPQFKMK